MDAKKIKKLNIKNFIKDNAPGSIRLQSLRIPRDLSLGGTKVAKKVYTPNLNAVRNKDKKDFSKKPNRKPAQKHDKTQEWHKDKFVQSSGVFSEGIGDSLRHPQLRTSKKHVKTANIPVSFVKIEPQPTQPPDQQIEKEVLDAITKFDDSSDSELDEKYPFTPMNWNASDLHSEDTVKIEAKSETSVSNTLPEEYSKKSCFDPNFPLALWQLPDSFSFKKDPDTSRIQKTGDFKLSDMPEGKIGKISVRKSGKVDVCIGRTKYELEATKFEGFMEEVVAMDAMSYQNSTTLALGEIQSRYLLNPDWEYLLH